MKFLDLHADIGFDVYEKHKHGESDVLKRYHLDKLLKGNVKAVGMASFFEGIESWDDMKAMVTTLEQEVKECEEFVIVDDIDTLKQIDDKHIAAIFTIEGMCGIDKDVKERIDWLYNHHVRIATLTWNEENALANGVGGNPTHGLSEMGIEAVKHMEELGMILDVSHANEKTFWDIMEHFHGMVIATHSNVYELCAHRRNLKDEQLKAIAQRGGVIGLNGYRYFISEDEGHQNIEDLIKHAAYMRDLIGIDHIALGMDFMDFFEDEEDSTGMVNGIPNASHLPALYEGLKQAGFKADEISKICFDNAYQILWNQWK